MAEQPVGQDTPGAHIHGHTRIQQCTNGLWVASCCRNGQRRGTVVRDKALMAVGGWPQQAQRMGWCIAFQKCLGAADGRTRRHQLRHRFCPARQRGGVEHAQRLHYCQLLCAGKAAG